MTKGEREWSKKRADKTQYDTTRRSREMTNIIRVVIIYKHVNQHSSNYPCIDWCLSNCDLFLLALSGS